MNINNMTFQEWIDWAKMPNNRRKGRNNILPEIVDYLTEHPEEFDEPSQLIEGRPHLIAASVSPRTWEAVSDSFIDQCLENTFGKRYDSIASMPKEEIKRQIAGIIGNDAAGKFADYIIQIKKS